MKIVRGYKSIRFSENKERAIRRDLAKLYKALGLSLKEESMRIKLGKLREAADSFMNNLRRDAESSPIKNLLFEFEEFLEHPNDDLHNKILCLSTRAVSVLLGEVPGFIYSLEAYGTEGQQTVVPAHEQLALETLKTHIRRSETGFQKVVFQKQLRHLVEEISTQAGFKEFLLETLCAAFRPAQELDTANANLRIATLISFFAKPLQIQTVDADGNPAYMLWSYTVNLSKPERLREQIEQIMTELLRHEPITTMRRLLCSAVESLLTHADGLERNHTLSALVKHDPAAFREYVRDTVLQQLTRLYQVDANPSSRRKDQRRHMEPSATWKVIEAVIYAAWPFNETDIGIYSLDNHTNGIMRNLIAGVINAAVPKFDAESKKEKEGDIQNARDRSGVPTQANKRINSRHVSSIASWMLHIHFLDGIIEAEKSRVHALAAGVNAGSVETRDTIARLQRDVIEPLGIWRRELKQRLRQGNYQKGKAAALRPSGLRREIPDIPKFKKGTPKEQRLAEILRLARTIK